MPKRRHFPELAKRVRSQRNAVPSLYGDVDFSTQPYRLALDPDDESSLPAWVAERGELLEDERTVELMSTATMLGDVVADPYAALMERQSLKSLIDMLQHACREGIEGVPGAPPELERFIAAMEQRPAWLDMDLVRGFSRALAPDFDFAALWTTILAVRTAQEEVKAFEHERSEKNFLFERQKALAEELAGMREEAVKVRVGFPSSYSIHSRGVS